MADHLGLVALKRKRVTEIATRIAMRYGYVPVRNK